MGIPYTAERVDFKNSQQTTPAYLAINPKGRVPALVTDRGVLTENPAILTFVAQSAPQAKLLPEDPYVFAQAQSFNSYLCSTVHINHAHKMRGYRWATDESSFGDMKRKVPETMAASFALISGAQVQRTRSLFPRAQLDAERRHFMDRKAAAYAAIDKADVDPRGRQIARAYVDAFYEAIADDAAYYRKVIAKDNVQLFADAGRGAPACGPKDLVRAGTPVNVLQASGTMSQVMLLDVMWRWGQADPCPAILRGPVWIASDAESARTIP